MQLFASLQCRQNTCQRIESLLIGVLGWVLVGCTSAPMSAEAPSAEVKVIRVQKGVEVLKGLPPGSRAEQLDLTPLREGDAAMAAENFDLALEKYSLMISRVLALSEPYVSRARAWICKGMPDPNTVSFES